MIAVDEEVVGHVMYSPVTIGETTGAGLGPMAVVPERQRQGIGSDLVTTSLERLRGAACPFVVVVGIRVLSAIWFQAGELLRDFMRVAGTRGGLHDRCSGPAANADGEGHGQVSSGIFHRRVNGPTIPNRVIEA